MKHLTNFTLGVFLVFLHLKLSQGLFSWWLIMAPFLLYWVILAALLVMQITQMDQQLELWIILRMTDAKKWYVMRRETRRFKKANNIRY
jgi:hypothetical protein